MYIYKSRVCTIHLFFILVKEQKKFGLAESWEGFRGNKNHLVPTPNNKFVQDGLLKKPNLLCQRSIQHELKKIMDSFGTKFGLPWASK